MNVIINKLDELIQIMNKQSLPLDKQLWTSKECATYLQCNEKHFQIRIASQKAFPTPSLLSSGERPTKRWVASEVISWAINNR